MKNTSVLRPPWVQALCSARIMWTGLGWVKGWGMNFILSNHINWISELFSSFLLAKLLLHLFMFLYQTESNPRSVTAVDFRVYFPANVLLIKFRAYICNYSTKSLWNWAVLKNLVNWILPVVFRVWLGFSCTGITWNVHTNIKVMGKQIWKQASQCNWLFSTGWLLGFAFIYCIYVKQKHW